MLTTKRTQDEILAPFNSILENPTDLSRWCKQKS